MAISSKEFTIFGVTYRTSAYSAILGFDILEFPKDNPPQQILCKTEILYCENWYPLSNKDNINTMVMDKASILSPLQTLKIVMSFANEYNFDFLNAWSGIKIPGRFISDGKSVSTKYSKPIIAQLISSKVATLRELEEYYSLEDAFKMFDILTAQGVNEALANEAAAKKR
jgi:hypothetical protein